MYKGNKYYQLSASCKQLSPVVTFKDYLPTSYKLALDTVSYKDALDLLEKGSYTEDDFIRLLKEIHYSVGFRNDSESYKRLCSIFASGSIPDEFLFKAFEDLSEYGVPAIQEGLVRQAYDSTKREANDEE